MREPRYPEAFERFWSAYPTRRPNPKAPAAAVFGRLTRAGRIVTGDELVGAAAAYAAECRRLKIDPAFVPHARTWLTQNRWLDYLGGPEPARGTSAPAGPDDGHPLAALAGDLSLGAWRSWIAPLVVEQGPDGPVVRAPTAFHAARVRTDHLPGIRRVLGPGVEVVP